MLHKSNSEDARGSLYLEKVGQKQAYVVMSHVVLKMKTVSYISVAENISLASISLT